jgi:hypothetical protein
MSNPTEIDNIFSKARNTEPYFDDRGFVTRVTLELPTTSKVSVRQESVITIAATIIGCIIVYQYFPVTDFIQLIPNHLSITPIDLLVVSSLVSMLSYWAAEE